MRISITTNQSETNKMQGMSGRLGGGQWAIGGRHGWCKRWNCWRMKQWTWPLALYLCLHLHSVIDESLLVTNIKEMKTES